MRRTTDLASKGDRMFAAQRAEPAVPTPSGHTAVEIPRRQADLC